MTRTADYTIQGFLYQFNKTLLEILQTSDNAEVTVEGIIEDIDIEDASGIKAIQCKYHEAQQNFELSLIYKPILQMMHHFHSNKKTDVKYILYAYFPSETMYGIHLITKEQMATCLQSKNKELKQYTDALRDKIDLHKFHDCFTLEFGEPLDRLVNSVCMALKENGISEGDVDILAYPNAIQEIANLSIKHDEHLRKITKSQLLGTLQQIRKTAISRWTLSLKNHKKILEARKKQLKANLDKNTRLRYFIINKATIDDFDDGIVLFIIDYLDKYHFKTAHISTPLFCLDCSQEDFKSIQLRLHQKGIISADGFVNDHFDKTWFFREPISRKIAGKDIKREFRIRLLNFLAHGDVMGEHKCDDLFIIGDGRYDGLDIQDVNEERLAVRNLKEIKYMMGVSNVYE